MTTTTKTTETPAARSCGCWCGEPLTGKGTFRQGHDQRLVSRLATELVEGVLSPEAKRGLGLAKWDEADDIQNRIDELTAAVGRVYSAGLATKVNSAAMRRWEKAGKSKKGTNGKPLPKTAPTVDSPEAKRLAGDKPAAAPKSARRAPAARRKTATPKATK